MATKKQEVATIEDERPAYLRELEAAGGLRNEDNFDQSDVVIPRVKLLQGLSKECETFDEAKPGLFWHTGFDVPLGSEIDFVICSRKKKYLLVAPLEDGQGILARAEDFVEWDRLGEWEVKLKGSKKPVTWKIDDLNVIKSGLDKWGTSNVEDENSPPAATLFYEYLVLLPDHMDYGPAVVSLTRSQIKKAKKGLNDKIALHEGKNPMQGLVFRAKAYTDKNSEGQDFKNWQFVSNGFSSKPLYDMATELKNVLKTYRVADEEDAVAEEAMGSAPAESKDF